MAKGVEVEGLDETQRALAAVQADLSTKLEQTAGDNAQELLSDLQSAAASSGVPVARRVASSAKVTRGRVPTVSIGGGTPVGIRGAPASDLLWGSESGGHHFGVPAGGSYWIAPTVERYRPKAHERVQRAVDATIRGRGL